MPPRLVTLAIVAFWAATSGWFVYREVLPRLHTEEPPAFGVHLTDEVQRMGPMRRHRWRILHDNHDVGLAQTWVRYDAPEDNFELNGRAFFFPAKQPIPNLRAAVIGPVTPEEALPQAAEQLRGEVERPEIEAMMPVVIPRPDMDSTGQFPVEFRSWYRIQRDGSLRDLRVQITSQPEQDSALKMDGGVAADLQGHVGEGFFSPHWWCRRGEEQVPDQPLEPVPVSRRGVVLNPLQPPHHLPGLYVGQRFRLPVLDLLAATRPEKRPDVPILEATVTEDVLAWGRRSADRPVECYLITCGGELGVRLWVRKLDDTVLQQEVHLGGQRLVLRRSAGPMSMP